MILHPAKLFSLRSNKDIFRLSRSQIYLSCTKSSWRIYSTKRSKPRRKTLEPGYRRSDMKESWNNKEGKSQNDSCIIKPEHNETRAGEWRALGRLPLEKKWCGRIICCAEGIERGGLHLCKIQKWQAYKKLRRKKRRCFLIQGQQKVVQKKKCDHGITCSP